jgi:hypothetical protein
MERHLRLSLQAGFCGGKPWTIPVNSSFLPKIQRIFPWPHNAGRLSKKILQKGVTFGIAVALYYGFGVR